MKIYKRFLITLLATILLLTCVAGCADEQQPSDGPAVDSPATPDDTPPDDTDPDDTDPDDTDPDDTDPDDTNPDDTNPGDDEPTFGVQAAENEKIIQIGLLGADDKTSYLRLVYDSAEHTRLTNIYTHHIVDSGEYEVTEIFRSTNPDTKDDVMVMLRWYVGPGVGGTRAPGLIIFREYNSDRYDQPLVNASYLQYAFYYEKAPINNGETMAYSSRFGGNIVTAPLDKPGYSELEIIDFLDDYEYFYEYEFERDPREYRHDLIYSCVGGKETMMQENLEQVVPFPWTLIKSVQKRK